jgi:hypothetical protein
MPMGGDLEFADELTLGRALSARRAMARPPCADTEPVATTRREVSQPLQFRRFVGVHCHRLGMGEVFIGSQAVRSGQLTGYQLRTDFRSIYQDVYVPK